MCGWLRGCSLDRQWRPRRSPVRQTLLQNDSNRSHSKEMAPRSGRCRTSGSLKRGGSDGEKREEGQQEQPAGVGRSLHGWRRPELTAYNRRMREQLAFWAVALLIA